mmetsp:Transcript_11615/g.36032  ORF Transcript_11615/g.36032 Transcript_11615/m.36032 type:complete len:290 (+) Transcript_11615:1210-2079(+)
MVPRTLRRPPTCAAQRWRRVKPLCATSTPGCETKGSSFRAPSWHSNRRWATRRGSGCSSRCPWQASSQPCSPSQSRSFRPRRTTGCTNVLRNRAHGTPRAAGPGGGVGEICRRPVRPPVCLWAVAAATAKRPPLTIPPRCLRPASGLLYCARPRHSPAMAPLQTFRPCAPNIRMRVLDGAKLRHQLALRASMHPRHTHLPCPRDVCLCRPCPCIACVESKCLLFALSRPCSLRCLVLFVAGASSAGETWRSEGGRSHRHAHDAPATGAIRPLHTHVFPQPNASAATRAP